MTGVSKTCTSCGDVLSPHHFYRDRSASDGRTARCRECVRQATTQSRMFTPATLALDPINRYLMGR
jgi:hypothetical protein